MGTDAFQEVDVLAMTMPVVKHGYLVTDPAEVGRVIREACRLAMSGRPGPVVVDIPKDVQLAEVDGPAPAPELCDHGPGLPEPDALSRASAMLAAAERPLVYAGGGVRIANARQSLRDFVDRTRVPAVLTLQALGSLPADHPANLGMLGMHGLVAANHAVQECDLLLVVAARFDDRVTGHLERFAPNAKVVHLDVDPAEVGKRRSPDVAVLGELNASLRALAETQTDCEAWMAHCAASKARTAWAYDAPGDLVYAPRLLRDLSVAAGHDAVVACDVGQHQMWVAQHWQLDDPRNHLSSGGLGAMGFGLPAAIGAQFAKPETPVVAVCGDGSVMMNIQELATVVRYGLPLKLIVLDNQYLGMVRQWQELFLERRYSEVDLSDNPDFAKVAEAFGIPSFTVSAGDEESGAIERLLSTPGPVVVHVLVDPEANVWPFVPPGAANHEMIEEQPCTA